MASTGTALFGSNVGSSSKNLVEFRAGKMKLNGTTVTADKRKGLVYVFQGDDSLMHFCWKDRSTATVEDDLIIFPDDVEYKPVKQCKTGRVCILKFRNSSRKLFFWMQEPKSDKDEELVKKVNDCLNNPPAPGSAGGLRHLGDQLIGDTSLQGFLGNMDQQQLLQLLGSGVLQSGGSSPGSSAGTTPRNRNNEATTTESPATTTEPPATTIEPPATTIEPPATTIKLPATTTSQAPASESQSSTKTTSEDKPATAASTTTSSSVQLSDLQNILQHMDIPNRAEAPEAVDLNLVITPEHMAPLLSNPETRSRLIPFLPSGEDLPRDEEQLLLTLQSPHFQQSLQAFSSALQSGQLGPIMSQFQLPEEAVQAFVRGNVQEVAEAMEGAKDETKGSKDDDEDMALD